MVLVLTMLFSMCATTIYAIENGNTSAINSGDGDETQNNPSGEFEQITIDPNDFLNQYDENEDFYENELVGDVITTPEGFRIRMNSDMSSYTIVEYVGISKTIDIPEYYDNLPITRIGDSVFFGNQRISKVVLHENIIFIGERAFDNCPLLIENANKDANGGCYIGTKNNDYYYFFKAAERESDREYLTDFTVHSDTKIVGSFAFEGCKNLKSITIGNGVKSVGYAAIMQCNSLESLIVPFLGENGKNEKNAFLGYIFGARTVGGNVSYVPTTLKNLTVNGGQRISFNALYGVDMIEKLTLPFLGNSSENSENAYLSYIFGGKSYSDNITPQSLSEIKIIGGCIGDHAFENTPYIEKIELGNYVTGIGGFAFYNCDSLESIVIPDSVITVGASAFEDCDNLLKVKIGNGVTRISDSMFESCDKLYQVEIGSGVKRIDSYAFYSCRNLGNITIPGNVESIGYWSFASSGVSNLTIEDGVKTIETQAFYFASLVSVNMGNTVTTIGDMAFSNCSTLIDINIPESVTTIVGGAFEECSELKTINISASVTTIGGGAFAGCDQLTNIEVSSDNRIYKSIDGNVYTKDGTKLVQYAVGKTDSSFVVSDDVTEIYYSAFKGCEKLISITLGKKVKTIRNNAFTDCTEIVEVINKSQLNIVAGSSDYGEVALSAKFVHNGDSKLSKIGDYSFMTLDGVDYLVGYSGNEKELTLPDSYKGRKYQIYKYAFRYNRNITKLIISDNVTSIGNQAFWGCYNLVSVTIGKSVTSIEKSAFSNCLKIVEIINKSSLDIQKGKNTHGEVAYHALQVHNGASVISNVNDYLFVTANGINYLVGYVGDETNLTLPASYNGQKYEIISRAFHFNQNITKITIPGNVTKIGGYAFLYCLKLTDVIINSGVTEIGSYAFDSCYSLVNVAIPDSVTKFGWYIFEYCPSIKYNEYDNGFYLGNSSNPYLVLIKAKLAKSCVINENTKIISAFAFLNCAKLESIIIPSGVTGIGGYAFRYCYALTSVVIPSSVTSMENNIFEDCQEVTVYCEANYKPDGWSVNWKYTGMSVVWGYDINSRSLRSYSVSKEKASANRKSMFANSTTNTQPITMAASVTASEGLYFYNNGDGTCYVRGIGSCTDTDIVIPSISPNGQRVTSIGSNAFKDCTDIKSVTIPDSVTEIKGNAFYQCTSLTRVTFGNSVTSIGIYAFAYCSSLSDVSWVNSVTTIGTGAFYECKALTSVTIGTCVTSIGSNAFSCCSNLKEIKFNAISMDDLTSARRAFEDAGTEGGGIKVTIGASVSKIPAYLFYDAYRITSVEFEKNSVCKSIGNRAFSGCEGIVSFVIPDNVINIDTYAFSRCLSLISVTIGSSVTTISDNAFYSCNRIVEVINKSALAITKGLSDYGRVAFRAIDVHNGASKIINVNDYLFMSFDGVNYLVSYVGNAEEITLPASYNGEYYEINKYAFESNVNITKLVVSDGVTKIGEAAFQNCSSITDVEISSSVKSIAGWAFYGCEKIEKTEISDLENWCNISFYDMYANPVYYAQCLYLSGNLLTELIIPDSVMNVSAYAFYGCKSIQSVVVSNGVLQIGSSAFADCAGIKSIVIEDSVTTINSNAFLGCASAQSITIGEGVTSISSNAFMNCSSLTEININAIALNGVYSSIFHNAGCDGSGIKVIIGAKVTVIPYYMFRIDSQGTNHPKITSVEFKEGSVCNTIGSYAFYDCAEIESIVLPDSLTTIGYEAFYGCSNIKSVDIPKSVSIIGDGAFANCLSLEKINVDIRNSSYKSIDGNLYTKDGQTLLQYAIGKTEPTFIIPDNVISVSATAFVGCTNLNYNVSDNGCYLGNKENPYLLLVKALSPDITSCIINENTKVIVAYAFDNCAALTSITIPENVTCIGDCAFRNCYSLERINFNAVSMDDFTSSVFSSAGRDGNGIKVTIGASVTKIPSRLFFGVKAITSVEFDNQSVCESIGEYAFNNCTSLQSIIIPITVTKIENYAFGSCTNLTVYCEAVSKPTQWTYYWNNSNCPVVWGYNNITSNSDYDYVIHGGRATITRYKGAGTSVVVPTAIDGYNVVSLAEAFCANENIKSVTIPKYVAIIGAYAFYKCKSLARVEFDEGSLCQRIDSFAFGSCNALASIVYSGEENEWRHIKKATDWKNSNHCEIVYTKESSGLLYDTNADITEFWVSGYIDTLGNDDVVIPELYSGREITKIYKNTFNGKSNITSISIPSTVKEIGENALKNCVNLVEFHLRADVENILFGILDGCFKLEAITLPFLGKDVNTDETDYIGYVFGANSYKEHKTKIPSSLKSIVILNGTDVASNAFASCTNVEVIEIPRATVSIGDRAFADCISLRAMVSEDVEVHDSLNVFEIPDSVTAVGREIFAGCASIKTIHIGEGLSTIDDYALENPLFGIDKSSSRLVAYTVSPSNAYFVADSYGILYRYMEIGYEKVEVAVIDVPSMANLTSYVMPEHIVEIGPYAFAYNSTIRAIELEHVRRIANNAFYCASELIYAVFSASLAERYAKEYADYVQISCQSSLATLNEYLYEEYKRANANIPEEKWPPFVPLTENNVMDQYYSCIGDKAFMGCLSLQKIDLYADNIISIGDYALADCPSLSAVNIGKNLEKLGFSAFGSTASGESSLERFTVDNANNYFKSIDGVLYSVNDDGSLTLEIYPAALVLYDVSGTRKVFTLPTGVPITAIQTYAFQGVKNNIDVIIRPSSELIIGDYAFANSRILSVTIGEKVTSLGLLRGEGEYTVFSDMEYLTSINVDKENAYYSSDNGVLFDKTKTKLIKYPSDKEGDVYEVPSSVSAIASMAFKRADNIKQVLISSYIAAIGLEAFYACSNLVLIYFDDAYAPVSVMENAFTTFVEIEDGVAYNPRTQIGYSEDYYSNGENGEYGWVNYAGIYNLASYDRLPELQRGNAGEGYYAVVVVDSDGVRLGNIQVSLTDYNGKTETITTGYGANGLGVATFYDLFGVEGLGFSLDFSLPYSLTVTDKTGRYREYTNPSIYLDEDMRITYITLSVQPVVFGVSCGESEINTETADVNKAQYDYPCIISGAHSHTDDGLICENGVIRETVRISVIAYCDAGQGYYFVDQYGKWVTSNGLYQNGVKICDPTDAEVYDGYVIFNFDPIINRLAEETDIEVRLSAESSRPGNATMSCSTVLNIHVFNFIVTEDDVDIQSDSLNIDLSKVGEIYTKLMGTEILEIKFGKNVKFTTDVDGDTVTMELKYKEKKATVSYSTYEEGYKAVSKRTKNSTYYFYYYGIVKDEKGTPHLLKYNVRIARDHEEDNYYYYQCRVLEKGKEVDKFYGAVNGIDPNSFIGSKICKDARSVVAPKAYLIYKYHLEKAKELKKYKDIGENYAEKIAKEPVNDEIDYKFNVSLSGDLVFKYDKENGMVPVTSKIKGEITVTFNWTTQFVVWVIPVIVEIDVNANGNAVVNLKYDEERKVHLDDAKLNLSVELSAYGGIGCKGFSGGFYGVVGTLFVLDIAPSFGVESWEVNADVGAQINALWWTKKFSFLSGKHYIIPPEDAQAVAAAYEEIPIAAAYLVDTYSLARNEELERGFRLFLVGNTLYKIGLKDMTGEYGYDEYNYVKLTLSKWNGYDWDEEMLLDGDNKKNDAAYTIYENQGKTYILFTQQTKVLTSDDSYIGASDLVMKLVTIDENGYVSGASNVIKRDNYVYLQQYAVIDGVPTVIWAENADNNILGVSPHNYYSEVTDEYHVFETVANSIWVSRYNTNSNTWGEPILVRKGLAPITDLALTTDGYISYIVDTNSDLADSWDRTMMRGRVDSGFTAINDTSVGSITSIEIIDGDLVYYYDALASDAVDAWTYFESQSDNQILPSDAPKEFVPVYDSDGNLTAILFHEAKTWTEGDTKVSGSAIYGIFLENGAWGEKVEINAYAPVEDYYVTEFDAQFISQTEILLYVSVINSETNAVLADRYIYGMEATLNVLEYKVDYANSFVTVTVQNAGALGTPVYLSLNNGEYTMLDNYLASGEKETYTIILSGNQSLKYFVKLSENENGKDSVELEEIDLNHSDLQIFGKQMLLGDNNTLLVAIKNTGNLVNAGNTVIRLGNIAEKDIISDEIRAIIDGIILEDGEICYIESEKIWIIKDELKPGEIKYFEIDLNENSAISDRGLISMALVPADKTLEKGNGEENNCAYVSYSELIGVLENGETLVINPEIIESAISADKEKNEDALLNYTAPSGVFVTNVVIDYSYINDYRITAGEISGTITIGNSAIKNLSAGEHIITVSFSDGTVCTVKLNVAKYHTVSWMDGNSALSEETLVIEGVVPLFGINPTKDNDAQYEYVFVGWSTTKNAESAEKMSPIYADTVYYAVWKKVAIKYTVTWVLYQENGDLVKITETYKYNDIPSYNGTLFAPLGKSFGAWDKDVTAVTRDVTYTAVYGEPNAIVGDINGDGIVNTRDLAMLKQYVVGKITLTETQIARCNVFEDYNSDGSVKINTRDIAVLQQYIVGSIDTLG